MLMMSTWSTVATTSTAATVATVRTSLYTYRRISTVYAPQGTPPPAGHAVTCGRAIARPGNDEPAYKGGVVWAAKRVCKILYRRGVRYRRSSGARTSTLR